MSSSENGHPIRRKSSQEAFPEVLELLSEGHSLLSISKRPGMPKFSTIAMWVNDKPERRAKYEAARIIGLEKMGEELYELANMPLQDYELEGHNDPKTAANLRRIAIDTKKWTLAKMLPRKFGDRVDVNHGGQPDNPVIQKIERVIIDPKTTK